MVVVGKSRILSGRGSRGIDFPPSARGTPISKRGIKKASLYGNHGNTPIAVSAVGTERSCSGLSVVSFTLCVPLVDWRSIGVFMDSPVLSVEIIAEIFKKLKMRLVLFSALITRCAVAGPSFRDCRPREAAYLFVGSCAPRIWSVTPCAQGGRVYVCLPSD